MSLSMTMTAMSDLALEREFGPVPDRTSASDWARLPDTTHSIDRIDAARAEMSAFLNLMHPASDAEALQTLRKAFPSVPLSERIDAIRTRFFA